MRLLSFSHQGRESFGVLSKDGNGIVDLRQIFPDVKDLSDLLHQERLSEVEKFASAKVEYLDTSEVRFLRTIPKPGKIICIGVNYGGRNNEYSDTNESKNPSVFVRFPASLTGHLQPLIRPPESNQLDYEGEIVVVMGKGGRRISRDTARQHIAGLTLGNEGTIRDWVRHAKFNVTQGKNWENSGSMGPYLVTLDEIPDFDELVLTTRVNGKIRQSDTHANMAYPIDFLISYLSTFITLEPGDVIYTGTPTGAGARFDPPIWLEPGDIIEVEANAIGLLINSVEDE